MATTLQQLGDWMGGEEDEHLEFKEAKRTFDLDDLNRYCAALANEGGGTLVLGVTNARPRRVVGTQAFLNLNAVKTGLLSQLRFRVDAEDLPHADGRVLVFRVPSRPVGMPIAYKGMYLMRSGGSLVPMTPDVLKRIFEEAGPDFSAEVCAQAAVEDLDPRAIERFRAAWARKAQNDALRDLPDAQLLADAGLLVGGGVTYAALVLLGTDRALGRFLAQAEVIFEYRSSDASVGHQQRKEYRRGFLLFDDDLWQAINTRNDTQHYQDGLFMWDVPTFSEEPVREAVLNAISHRDYRLGGSVFVRQLPRRLEVVSPGGLPPGVTPENIFWRQVPRNRRLAEALAKCGLVERSGQGMDRMFVDAIRHSKPLPDFSGTDDYQVSVTLRGEVSDPGFLRFLEHVGRDLAVSFGAEDFLVLDRLNRGQPVPAELRGRLPSLVEHGVIERVGHGRGTRHVLSRRFHAFLGRKGTYTRRRGLDRHTNKALLRKHLQDNRTEGSRLRELCQVLPALSRKQVQGLLRELKGEGRARVRGKTRAALWFPGDANCGESHQ